TPGLQALPAVAAEGQRRRGRAWPSVYSRSTEDLAGDGVEPSFGEQRLLCAHRTRRIDWAHTAGALDVRQHAVERNVDTGDSDTVIGADDAVAGVDELGSAGRLARQQLDDGGG